MGFQFPSGYVNGWCGLARVTPNCCRGLTVWAGALHLVYCPGGDAPRGLDLGWRGEVVWSLDF